MFIFVELFPFVGEQIGFEVLVFGPAGPDIEPGRCTFLSILVFRIYFSFWISWFQNLEICPPFLRNSCDEIFWWLWVTIVSVIIICRYVKLSWNTSSLSQSNGRNFSGSSIMVWNHTCVFKSNSRCALVRFWNHAYDLWPNCTPLSSITIINNVNAKLAVYRLHDFPSCTKSLKCLWKME